MSTDPLIDALGTIHRPASGEVRIVSLVPSLTELLFALGLGPQVVGRTGFCIHPRAGVEAVPKVGGTKDVNIQKVLALAPTHLVVNIDENEKPTVEQLARHVPHVIVTHPCAPRDNIGLYRLFGGIFGVPAAAGRLEHAFARAFASLAARSWIPQKVLYCIWKDPWMTVSRDTYIGRMLALVGLEQVEPPSKAGADAARYPRFAWSDALAAGVDHVLLSTEPYRFTEEHADALERQLGKPVTLVDGEMMSWYGSRAVAGLGYLEQMRHALDGAA